MWLIAIFHSFPFPGVELFTHSFTHIRNRDSMGKSVRSHTSFYGLFLPRACVCARVFLFHSTSNKILYTFLLCVFGPGIFFPTFIFRVNCFLSLYLSHACKIRHSQKVFVNEVRGRELPQHTRGQRTGCTRLSFYLPVFFFFECI